MNWPHLVPRPVMFDGLRPASTEERLHELLTRVPVGFHWHLMHRDPDGEAPPAVRAAERDADRLAYELLAPAADVLTRAGGDRRTVVRALRTDFGLPPAQAQDYGALLLPEAAPADPLLRRSPQKSCRTFPPRLGRIREGR